MTDVFIHPRFAGVYQNHPLVLVDVGARGGLRSNWAPASRHLQLVGFEPDKREFARLSSTAAEQAVPTRFFDVALHNRKGPIHLNIARDRGLTSIFEPDRPFLDTFPDAGRFDTIDVQTVDADTLDNVLSAASMRDVDFVKADTQGSELYVLEGACEALRSSVVGVEVEAEFTAIYKSQPVFADVDRYLRDLGFQLFDLRPVYWKRAVGRSAGGPRGQIIWADALYFKQVPALKTTLDRLSADARKAKLLKAISIALLYGYKDYALEIHRELGSVLDTTDRDAVESAIRNSGPQAGVFGKLPGARRVAAAMRRVSRAFDQPRDAWSVSRAKLGNDD